MEELHERSCHGIVGVHEGTKKILAVADPGGSAFVRYIDCVDTGFSRRSFYLYVILMQGKGAVQETICRLREAVQQKEGWIQMCISGVGPKKSAAFVV
jgi:hypothetical protein